MPAATLGAEEPSPNSPAIQTTAGVQEGYEIGEMSLSSNERFAILYPIHRGEEETAELPLNLTGKAVDSPVTRFKK